jgi:hypothetical protein
LPARHEFNYMVSENARTLWCAPVGRMPKPFRRIVTANDSDGRSEVQLDEPATKELATRADRDVGHDRWTAQPHRSCRPRDEVEKSRAARGRVRFQIYSAAASICLCRNERRAARAADGGGVRGDECRAYAPGRQQEPWHAPDQHDRLHRPPPERSGWFWIRRSAISSRSTLSSNAGPTMRGSTRGRRTR